MTATKIAARLADRNFRLSLDFQPLTADDRLAFAGIGKDSAEIAYFGDAVIIVNHVHGTYTVHTA